MAFPAAWPQRRLSRRLASIITGLTPLGRVSLLLVLAWSLVDCRFRYETFSAQDSDSGSGGADGIEATGRGAKWKRSAAGSSTAGGAENQGGAGGTNAGAAGLSSSTDYVGQWTGQPKWRSSQYDLELAVADPGAGESVSLFYLPGPADATCGGFGRLVSSGTTLVYDETLLFGEMAYCLGAGRTTLTPATADSLIYDWADPGSKRHDRGTLVRRTRTGATIGAGFKGIWTGTLAQSQPRASREVLIAVDQAAVGDSAAHLLYVSPGNHCGGSAILGSAKASTLVLTELLSSVGEGCPANGTITLTMSGTDLRFDWKSSSAATTAIGTLKKAP